MTGAQDDLIVIEAGRTGLTLGVGEDGRLHQIGFGVDGHEARPELPIAVHPLAYPTFGEEVLREPALRVTQVDGATSTRLRFEGATVEDHEHGAVHRVDLRERVADLAVTLWFRTWPAYDVLEQWVEITNTGAGDCTVHRAGATGPSFAGYDAHLTHWGGGWAGEWAETTERLTPGTKTVASAGGVRPSLHRPPVVLIAPGGRATETAGIVGACTLLWGGDARFDAEVHTHGNVRLIAGHQGRGAERVLEPGQRFESPHALWTWSDAGVGPTSRALHRFAREQVVRDGTGLRATVVNTWEGMFFDLSPAKLLAQVDRGVAIGGELFLLDDGWFGMPHPRDDDTSSLGDWDVDVDKLPGGLQPIIDHALASGLRFGLWVEPEMVNARSALYEAHPDWVVGEPGRERREERNQLILDVCRPEVRDFVVGVIDRVLTEHTGITYLKWDANRDVTEPGSSALPADRQSHLPVDRALATWAIMDAVRERHPEVELMACASGGGRSDLGTLSRFHELWTSDDTDPVDRVRIQWGASHLLPASVLGAHVTRWGEKPFAFACAVALSGRFGFDVDLQALTDEEQTIGADASATYARIGDLVQQGDLYRVVSPVGSDRAALAYVNPAGDRAVVFAYRLPDAGPGPVSVTVGPGDPGPIELPWLTDPAGWSVEDVTPGRVLGDANPVALVAPSLVWPAADAPAASVRLLSRSAEEGTPR